MATNGNPAFFLHKNVPLMDWVLATRHQVRKISRMVHAVETRSKCWRFPRNPHFQPDLFLLLFLLYF